MVDAFLCRCGTSEKTKQQQQANFDQILTFHEAGYWVV
jgi:hypothetical protein